MYGPQEGAIKATEVVGIDVVGILLCAPANRLAQDGAGTIQEGQRVLCSSTVWLKHQQKEGRCGNCPRISHKNE